MLHSDPSLIRQPLVQKSDPTIRSNTRKSDKLRLYPTQPDPTQPMGWPNLCPSLELPIMY